jgi:hypothetical protein
LKVELYDHQKKAVDELGNGKILRADPGVGKTMTALAYFYIKECGGVLNDWGSLKTPKDLYVITTAKKRNDGDWQRDAYYLGLMEDPEISVSGIKVTVDSWNNIEKYKEVTNAFFIFDEQKVVGSGPWAKSFIAIAKANRWILLSATPGDTWLDYAPVFLANGFYKNITEFKHTHVVYSPWHKFPKVERYNGLGRLVRNRNEVLVEMPYDRHTTRHLTWVEVGHDTALLERVTKQRWHVYENRPLRDVTELFSVARKVVNSAPSRLEAVRKIQKKHKRVIVFYNFDYELELLRTLSECSPGSEECSSTSWLEEHSSTGLGVKALTSTSSTQTDLTLTGGQAKSSSPTTLDSSSTKTEDPWQWLLSEEGKRANANRQAGDTPRHLYDTPTDQKLDPKTIESVRLLTTPGPWTALRPEELEANSWRRTGPTRSTGETAASSASKTGSASMASTDASEPKTGSRARTVFKEIGAAQPTHRPSLKSTVEPKDSKKLGSRGKEWSSEKSGEELQSDAKESGRSGSAIAVSNGHNESRSETWSSNSTQPSKNSTSSTTGSNVSNTNGGKGTRGTVLSLPSSQVSDSGGSSTDATQQTTFAIAEWNGHKHEPVPTTDEWVYLVQYRAGAEAWNCTTTDTVIFWSPTYSYKDFEQSQGRIDRLNTPFDDLYYWALYSDSWIDKAVKGSLDVKQDFNEKRYEKKLQADLYAEELVERMAA